MLPRMVGEDLFVPLCIGKYRRSFGFHFRHFRYSKCARANHGKTIVHHAILIYVKPTIFVKHEKASGSTQWLHGRR